MLYREQNLQRKATWLYHTTASKKSCLSKTPSLAHPDFQRWGVGFEEKCPSNPQPLTSFESQISAPSLYMARSFWFPFPGANRIFFTQLRCVGIPLRKDKIRIFILYTHPYPSSPSLYTQYCRKLNPSQGLFRSWYWTEWGAEQSLYICTHKRMPRLWIY